MKIIPTALAIASLAACGKPNAVADDAKNVDALPTFNTPAPSPTGAPPANAVAANSAPAPKGSIPELLQGRWGLTPADCTSSLGDAKGLLVVNSSELRFYESRAVPTANADTTTDSIGGDFNFAGEGQTWTRYESLELRQDKLIRTERNPVASFSYARCE
jgi:hypothetical protein